MNKEYKFKHEYKMRAFDEILDDNNKITFITYGNSAKELVENHRELMDEWWAYAKEESKKTIIKYKRESKKKNYNTRF
jgi:hypothetical protein